MEVGEKAHERVDDVVSRWTRELLEMTWKGRTYGGGGGEEGGAAGMNGD